MIFKNLLTHFLGDMSCSSAQIITENSSSLGSLKNRRLDTTLKRKLITKESSKMYLFNFF